MQHEGQLVSQPQYAPASVNTSAVATPTASGLHGVNGLGTDQYDEEAARKANNSRRRKRSAANEVVLPYGLVDSQSSTKRENRGEEDGIETAGKSKRRKKAQMSEEAEEMSDEAAAKGRGRPRLDPKDETAADRRRTQIRLAQRAYRNRKETTISELEKQVQELKSSNEEMSNMFMSLYDLVTKRGLMQKEPEIAGQLLSMRNQVLGANGMNGDESVKSERAIQNEKKDMSILDSEMRVDISEPQLETNAQPSMWGYQVILDGSGAPDCIPKQEAAELLSIDGTPASSPQQQYSDMSTYLRTYHAQSSINIQPTITPYLSPPQTFSNNETTFARRLTRYAVERALLLVQNRLRFPRRYEEVFGFCLQYQDPTAIVKRLQGCLSSTTKSPVYSWREPFVHLGGAGTYYPNHDPSTIDGMPRIRTGMSMGPFDAGIWKVKDDFLDADGGLGIVGMDEMGFGGEFFDGNDVESYLFNKGIDLGGNPEVVQIDLDAFQLRNDAVSSSSDASILQKEAMGFESVMSLSNPSSKSPYANACPVIEVDDNADAKMMALAMGIADWTSTPASGNMPVYGSEPNSSPTTQQTAVLNISLLVNGMHTIPPLIPSSSSFLSLLTFYRLKDYL